MTVPTDAVDRNMSRPRKLNLARERRKRGLCPACGKPPGGGGLWRVEQPNGRGAYVCLGCHLAWEKTAAPRRPKAPLEI
jgi:hypothetical protein